MKLIEKTNSEFKHLVDKELNPGVLLLELQKCGINLLPVDDDVKLAEIH